jgi:hypothetical protein
MDALFCSIESGWVTDNSDCDDTETSINPGETEITGDGVDQNCDEKEICYFDGDNDGYGGTTTLLSALGDVSCTNSNRALLSGDCQDTVFSVNPGQTDTVGDTVDNNCDGIDGVDADDDYFASEASGGTDCNDNNGDAYPMAEEYPGIIDLNCDGFESTDNDCFSSFDGSTYYLYCDSYVSWSTARDNCEDNGYELTSIRDSTENTHVQDNLFTTSWIGYRDTDSSKSCIGSTENVRFTWTDGYFGYYDIEYDWCTTSTTSSGYNNWKSGEPNNSNADEGCAEIYTTTGKWNDRDCDATRYYVCSMR